MLIEIAIGDAYGAGFEYVSSEVVARYNDLTGYFQHPRHRTLLPGQYTDDTQMSLAIAEVMVSGDAWTPKRLADAFVLAFHRDPREGYAKSFHEFLVRTHDGNSFLTRIHPNSDKSGAAMRAAPIGVLSSINRVIRKCQVQAALTHNTPDGINAALAAALMTHYFLYRLGPKKSLGQFLENHVRGSWAVPSHGKVGPKGWMSVRAAITAISESRSMCELLKRCIAFTGDVDTVAAIAMAAGSCSEEIAKDLPDHLHRGLENGIYGYDYIKKLDQELLALCS